LPFSNRKNLNITNSTINPPLLLSGHQWLQQKNINIMKPLVERPYQY